MLIFQSPGSNATEVNQRIDQMCEEMKATMPDGLEFVTLMNADDFLFAAIHNVVETLVIAIILVILVVFFFLQNVKATIIPSISVIVSLMGTFVIVTLAHRHLGRILAEPADAVRIGARHRYGG